MRPSASGCSAAGPGGTQGPTATGTSWSSSPTTLPEADLDLGEAWRVRSGTGIAADIVPVRHGEFMEDLAVPGALPYEVAMDGVLLHER